LPRAGRILDQAEHRNRGDGIECVFCERQIARIRNRKNRIGAVAARPLAGGLNHLRRCVYPGDHCAAPPQFDGKDAVTAADIENRLPAGIAHEFEKELLLDCIGDPTERARVPPVIGRWKSRGGCFMAACRFHD
jgi:hypothetical protein